MEAFQNARKITTPGVNSKLAIPYKLPEVTNRADFKQAYSSAKQNITRVSGQFVTSREEEKERRRSLPFDWPSVQGIQVNQIKVLKYVLSKLCFLIGEDVITVFSNTGRDLGTNKFPDYDMGVHSKPFYNPTDVESKFKDLSMEMNRKNEVIEEQRKQLEEKDRIIEELRLRFEVNETKKGCQGRKTSNLCFDTVNIGDSYFCGRRNKSR